MEFFALKWELGEQRDSTGSKARSLYEANPGLNS